MDFTGDEMAPQRRQGAVNDVAAAPMAIASPGATGRSGDGRSGGRGTWRGAVCLAGVLACVTGSARAAGDYPLNLTLEANAATAAAAVTSSVIVRVDRLMEENRRKRVMDALTHTGYANFLNA